MKERVTSYDPLQPGYSYTVDSKLKFREDFTPDYTPLQCLKMGIFGRAYFTGYTKFHREFHELFDGVQFFDKPDYDWNYFGIEASMSRREWVRRGWMHDDDPRGWFQWYCRYSKGRRHEDDDRQISRWKAFKKRKLIEIGDNDDITYKIKTRQGLLHWGIASPGMKT